jgi:hypothetical protein
MIKACAVYLTKRYIEDGNVNFLYFTDKVFKSFEKEGITRQYIKMEVEYNVKQQRFEFIFTGTKT